jgi:hypothetical protein
MKKIVAIVLIAPTLVGLVHPQSVQIRDNANINSLSMKPYSNFVLLPLLTEDPE